MTIPETMRRLPAKAMPPRDPATGRILHKSPDLRHDLFATGGLAAFWLAGLIAADGSVESTGRRWSLSQSGDTGKWLIERVAELITYTGGVHTARTTAQDSHLITVTSPQMVSDLRDRFLLTPRKTTTLRWPGLVEEEAAAFLRGYVDGDGCVSSYDVARAKGMLHISMVGTAEFISGARPNFPQSGRLTVIKRCANLVELRWSGRYAWAAGQWLYQHGDALPLTGKASRFRSFLTRLETDPPAWASRAVRKEHVLALLAQGVPPMRVAEQTGESFQTVYKWRSRA